MSNATQELVALVVNKLGHAEYNPVSDRKLGKFFGVSHTHAARLRRGDYVMSRELFGKAMLLLELPAPEMLDFSARLDADAAQDDGVREYMLERARQLADFKGFGVKAGSVLLAACLAWLPLDDAAALEKPAPGNTATGAATSEQCILCKLASRLRNAARRFVRLFPVPPLLPAQLPAM